LLAAASTPPLVVAPHCIDFLGLPRAGHHFPLKKPRRFANHGQGYAYSDCLKRSRGRHEWIAFIDLDEFIVMYDDR
jgi:hypothetical protein